MLHIGLLRSVVCRILSPLFDDCFNLRECVHQVKLFISARQQAVVSSRNDLAHSRLLDIREGFTAFADDVEVEQLRQQLLRVESVEYQLFRMPLHVSKGGVWRSKDLVCGKNGAIWNDATNVFNVSGGEAVGLTSGEAGTRLEEVDGAAEISLGQLNKAGEDFFGVA